MAPKRKRISSQDPPLSTNAVGRWYPQEKLKQHKSCNHVHPDQIDPKTNKVYTYYFADNDHRAREIYEVERIYGIEAIGRCPNPDCSKLVYFLVKFKGWKTRTKWGEGILMLEANELFDGSTRLLYDYYEVKLRQMKVAIDAAQNVPQQPVNEQQPVDIADLILRYQELQADMEELQRIRQLMHDRDNQLRDSSEQVQLLTEQVSKLERQIQQLKAKDNSSNSVHSNDDQHHGDDANVEGHASPEPATVEPHLSPISDVGSTEAGELQRDENANATANVQNFINVLDLEPPTSNAGRVEEQELNPVPPVFTRTVVNHLDKAHMNMIVARLESTEEGRAKISAAETYLGLSIKGSNHSSSDKSVSGSSSCTSGSQKGKTKRTNRKEELAKFLCTMKTFCEDVRCPTCTVLNV